MKLVDYLKLNRIRQAAFAKAAGVSQGYVSQVISGKSRPRGSNAIKWSEVTGWQVTPHELNRDDYPGKKDGLPEKFH